MRIDVIAAGAMGLFGQKKWGQVLQKWGFQSARGVFGYSLVALFRLVSRQWSVVGCLEEPISRL